MRELFAYSELSDIMENVYSGQRLSREDGIRLMKSTDLLAIGHMADVVRKRKNGDNTYFIVNRHINHTNICKVRCKLCAFGVDADHETAYLMDLDEIEKKAAELEGQGVAEIHIVGGCHPDLTLEYAEEMIRRVAKVLPNVNIKAFTAVEIDHFAERDGLPIKEVLTRLKEAGFDSIPGGGAEIFASRVREKICAKKISGERWLDVHKAAHELGIRTNATMLYGHIETAEERIDHLLSLRELQDQTGGFLTYIPLAFHPKNTGLESEVITRTTGFEDLKVLAIARLMLDNIDHIKAFWVMVGPKLAQVSLAFGVDDIDGTVVEYKITHAAGGSEEMSLTKKQLVKMIKDAGKKPIERDTVYNIIRDEF